MLIFSLCMSALLLGWIITCIWLGIRISKGKRYGKTLCTTILAPFLITPLLGLMAGGGGASDWNLIPGVIAAPAIFFGSPFIAYHEYSEINRRKSFVDAYQAIEDDPAVIWDQNLYTFGSERPPEKQAAHKYIKNNFEGLTEDQLMILVREGWRDEYIRSPKLSAAFLREIFEKYKDSLHSRRLPSTFFMNPNCPPDILEEVFYNPDHYGDSRVRAVLRNLNCPVHILSDVGNNREKYGDLLFSFALQHINCPSEILERVISNSHEYKSHMLLDARKTLESQTSEDF